MHSAGKNTRSRAASNADDQSSVSLQSLDKKLDKILSQITIINQRLDKLEVNQKDQEKSLQFFHDDLEETKRKVEEIQSNLTQTRGPSQPIENLMKRVEANEHANRAKCIELNGIPYGKGENLIEGMEKLIKHMDFNWLNITTDVDNVYRIRKTKKVIVKFTQTGKRDMFFQRYRKNIASAQALGFGDDQRIYINEVLSSDQASLFWKARNFKKQNQYRYIWTFNQRIYLRKTAETDAIQINSEQDLDTLSNSS